MIVQTEKHLFQWDVQQNMIAHCVDYIDYVMGGEVVRVRVVDDRCPIPDEILQDAGTFTCWGCIDTGTRTEYAFQVKARPMPPDYVFTPTQRETFDQLVERVDRAVYEARYAAENANGAADQARQSAETADTAATNAETVAAMIRQMAIEGEFDGYSPEVKLEPVEGGTLLTITDRQGEHTAFIKDGSSAEITKQVIIEALGYTPADEGNTYSKAEVDRKEADTLASAKTYTDEQVADVRQEMSDKMGFYPVSLEGSPLQFIHHEKDGTDTILGFTELADKYNDPKWFLYCEYAAVTFIPSLPPVEDPVHPDRVLEFSAAWYYSGSHWLTSIKINEGNQIKIEEHQIPTRDEMNAELADKVGFTDYATTSKAGVVIVPTWKGLEVGSSGELRGAVVTDTIYQTRSNDYVISKGTLENIKESLVKSVVDKPWTLKGILTTENKDTGVQVDLSGCSEVYFIGTGTATGNATLQANGSGGITSFAYGFLQNGENKSMTHAYTDMFGYITDVAKRSNNAASRTLESNLTSYNYVDGTTIESIKQIRLSNISAVKSCNIEIYAR